MRVEQAAAGERNPKHRLDDVADGAVVWQTDLLCSVHEVTATEDMRAHGRCLTHEGFFMIIVADLQVFYLTSPKGSSSKPGPDSHRSQLLQWQTRS